MVEPVLGAEPRHAFGIELESVAGAELSQAGRIELSAAHGVAELSASLLERGRIAATPMTAWGSEVAPRYVRFDYANEQLDRLRGIGDRVRAAL